MALGIPTVVTQLISGELVPNIDEIGKTVFPQIFTWDFEGNSNTIEERAQKKM